jgi:hypothetical protein
LKPANPPCLMSLLKRERTAGLGHPPEDDAEPLR